MSGYKKKKMIWTTNKAALGGLLPTFMHRIGWWDFGILSLNQDILWSQFQGYGDPNVKIPLFTAHHGGTSGDTVDKSSWIKAWGGIEKDQWHEMG